MPEYFSLAITVLQGFNAVFSGKLQCRIRHDAASCTIFLQRAGSRESFAWWRRNMGRNRIARRKRLDQGLIETVVFFLLAHDARGFRTVLAPTHSDDGAHGDRRLSDESAPHA